MLNGIEHWMVVNDRPNVRIVRGRASRLEDDAGRVFLDFIQGWAVNCLGHSPEVIRQALIAQADAVINVGPALYNAPALSLAAALAGASGLDRVFLANSGAEANEGAVKLARRWGQKHRAGAYEVITTTDGFHGRTMAMTCATGKAGWDSAFPPKVDGFPKVPYGDLAAIRASITDRTVGVMVEPIQGEAGVVMPEPGYLRGIREICDEAGILFLCDEVQTGLCRTGPRFAFQMEDVLPDILTLGKGLGGGLPVAALLAKENVACFERGDHGSTFGGNALMASAALAVVSTLLSPSFERTRAASSAKLEAALASVATTHGASLRGRGHLFAIVFDRPISTSIVARAFELGLLLNAPRPNVLRFMPALDVDDASIDEMAMLLDRAIRDLAPRPVA